MPTAYPKNLESDPTQIPARMPSLWPTSLSGDECRVNTPQVDCVTAAATYVKHTNPSMPISDFHHCCETAHSNTHSTSKMLTPNHQPHALCTPHFPSRNLTTNHDNLPTNPPSSQNPHQYHQATHHYVHKNLLLGFNARKRFYTITSALAGIHHPR
ncbi:hypothetical protein PMIN06_013175 [Paraphaeosphaeria minitans]